MKLPQIIFQFSNSHLISDDLLILKGLLYHIKENFRILREDKRMLDVTLVTDDGQHILAHKIILSAGSQFFNTIFVKSNQTNV